MAHAAAGAAMTGDDKGDGSSHEKQECWAAEKLAAGSWQQLKSAWQQLAAAGSSRDSGRHDILLLLLYLTPLPPLPACHLPPWRQWRKGEWSGGGVGEWLGLSWALSPLIHGLFLTFLSPSHLTLALTGGEDSAHHASYS